MDPTEKTMRAYDEIAEKYCEKTMKEGKRNFQKMMLDRTLDHLHPKSRIIDLGCGDGRDTEYMRKKNFDVVGIDFSQGMISLARKKYPRCAFLDQDIRDTVFPDDMFHGAWANASLINLPKSELSHAEKEIYRIVEPGGLFCFSFKEGKKEGFETSVIDENERYYSYYSLDEIKESLNLFNVFKSEICPEKVFGHEFIYCWARARR